MLARANIKNVPIPKKMTHICQPADQWIIAVLKAKVNAARDESVQSLFATMGVQEAVAEFCCRSAPVFRKRMYKFYASAIDSINMATIIGSWDVTGILQILYSDVPRSPLNFDTAQQRVPEQECANECGTRSRTLHLCANCVLHWCQACKLDHDNVLCQAL